jgi:hypothetical protein
VLNAQHVLSTREGCSTEGSGRLRSLCVCFGNEEQNPVSRLRRRCQQKNSELDCQETKQEFEQADDGRKTALDEF